MDDAPESIMRDGMSPAMVAFRNCLVLSVAPYSAPTWLSSNSLRPILSATALINPTRISPDVVSSVMEYAVASGGALAGFV